MAIQGMRIFKHQSPVTIDVNDFYTELVEASRRNQSVVVLPIKKPEPEVITAPESVRERARVREEEARQRRGFSSSEVSPIKLAARHPDLAGRDSDLLLYDVGGSPTPTQIAEDTVTGFREAITKIKEILDNL